MSEIGSPGRFLLHFNPMLTEIDDQDEQEVSIYASGKFVYIRCNDFSSRAKVFVYDMYGREIASQSLAQSTINKIRLHLNNSNVIVKTVDKGEVNVRKLFIQ